MSLLTDYRRNYDQIANDHVEFWRQHGRNPFQDPIIVKENEDATFGNVTRYVPAGSRVLDAGCGIGDLMLRLREYYDVIGAEIAKPYLKILGERDLMVLKADIEKLPAPKSHFDGVVAADVLEHVIDIHAAAEELVRVLKVGGHIIVRVPNMDPACWTPIAGYEFTHLRILDEGTIRNLFGRILGCTVEECYVEGSVLHLVARK